MSRTPMTQSERAEKWAEKVREEELAEGAFSQEGLQRPLDAGCATLFSRKGPLIVPAVEVVMRRYGKYLRTRALKQLGSVDAAEEVVQETWIDLYAEGIIGGS